MSLGINFPPGVVSISGNTAGALALISSGTLALAGGANITLSQNGNSVSIIGGAGGTAGGGGAGTGFTSATTAGVDVKGTLGTDGLSLGVPAYLTTAQPVGAYLTTAQPVGAYLTTARASNDAIGLNSALTANGVSVTANSSGLSLNFPAFLTTAALSNHSHGNPTLALTSLSGTTASNSAGFTLSLAAGAYLTTAALSNHSHGNPTLALTNLTGTTASNSAGLTLSLSAAAPGVGGGGAGTGFTSAVTAGALIKGTLSTDGLSLGVPSYLTTAQPVGAYLTTARASNDAIGLNTALTANGVAWTVNSSGLSLNVPAFLTTAALSNHSHGNPSLALTNLSGTTASNSNGFTLSLAAAAPGGGAGVDRGFMEIMDGDRFTTCAVLNNGTYSNRVVFVPFVMKEGGSLAVNTVRIFVSRSTGTILLATLGVGFYTVANTSSINLAFSTTHVFSVQSSVSWSGIRAIDFTGMGANSLTAGEWVMGLYNSAAASNSCALHVLGGDGFVMAGYIGTGTNQTAASHSQSHIAPFWGVWNATTAGFPAAVAASSISGGNPAANSPDIYAIVKEY